MRLPSLLGPTAADCTRLLRVWPLLWSIIPASHAFTFNAVPPPSLDLSQLGRVGLVGDFDSISLYSYEKQTQDAFSTNGSQSVLAQAPNGAFASLLTADASILSMCPFVMKDGTLAGIVVGGNFTSLGGVAAQGAALIGPDDAKVTPLTGLSGKVSAVLCDQATNTVYFGGEFTGLSSTNAIAWVGMDGWTNLPFAGLNGPVNTVAKETNGKIVFGGDFDGLGNKSTGPSQKDQQVVNLADAEITAASTTDAPGFDQPSAIVCNPDGQGGPDKTWRVADGQAGSWRADFSYGFRPTKLRLWNAKQEGRGTKIFRYTAFPSSGIMNLTYTDPETDKNATCDARCPLSDSADIEFQDFTFVNNVGMTGFQIDVSEWYGDGGGLNGIQLFQDDIYAFAIGDFNEPTCANVEFGSTAQVRGDWLRTPRRDSNSDYLSLSGSNVDPASSSVEFQPNIKQSGDYKVTLFTPGCSQDNTCATRGSVNVTWSMATDSDNSAPSQKEIFQTNDFDKYDEIYTGRVDANGGSFRPTVTVSPSAGQEGDKTYVAQRVRFEPLFEGGDGGLNGLYEFDPNNPGNDEDLKNSPINKAGTGLEDDALVNIVITTDDVIYVGGNFSTKGFKNIFAIADDNSTSLPGGGLNDEVSSMLLEEQALYVGGGFTNTERSDAEGLNNVAVFSTSDKAWQPLGAGVNGRVNAIVPLSLNISEDTPEIVITLTGSFDEILAFDGTEAAPAEGLAIWVPSKKNWLNNLNDLRVPSFHGQLTAAVNVPGGNPFYAGALSSLGLAAAGAVTLPISGDLSINPLPIEVQPTEETPDSRKRAIESHNITGVVTGYFYTSGDRNITILGGHFTATASDGSSINNLAFIDGANSDEVTGLTSGLDEESAFLSLTVSADTLYAGGTVTGTVDGADVNGLILYDLAGRRFVENQPPALSGSDVSVNAIAKRPSSTDIYVAGNFDSAGLLPCPSVCYFTSESQWNRPGVGLTGSVGAMVWSSTNQLIVGGQLTINNTNTSVVTYDAKSGAWELFEGADTLPGPVSLLTAANDDVSRFWVAGTSRDGKAFLMNYDGSAFQEVTDQLGEGSKIRGIQVFSLSESHDSSDLVNSDEALLITGELSIPNFGNASAALYDGNSVTPFMLSNIGGTSPGSLSQIFSEKQNYFNTNGGGLAIGFVVLIALAIALALIFLLVVIGIIAERLRRKREGYVPAPTGMYDKQSNIDRIPPSHLFGNLGQQDRGPGGAPMI
ncbi:MAG: hypothetical protein M1833_000278 [Piccolia ochrophora]|nr:MAG: hypothetical protein M1833_000278 [Piccolia ochrophora]